MAAKTEGYVAKLTNEVLQAAEHIVTRFDEGASAILHGKLPDENGGENTGDSDASDFHMSDDNDPLLDDDMEGSPLEGIAESVIGDIMGGQVCNIVLFCLCCGGNDRCTLARHRSRP